MGQARDQAGHIWETDAQGNPVRLLQQAGSGQGGIFTLPQTPKQKAEAAGSDLENLRKQQAIAEWSATHNPDGSPKVVAPPLLGDANTQGPEYLKTLPANMRNRVQQLLDGRSILTAREKGTPLGQQLMDAANQADPNFDENASHARYTARQQFTGMGKGSLNVQAADRMAQHVNDLYSASMDLGGPDLGWSPLSNAVNGVQRSFQQEGTTRYKTILPLIAGELQKLTKNGAATEGESKLIMENLAVDKPLNVRNAAIKEIVKLGRAQVTPLHDAWASAWAGGNAPPMPMDVNKATNAIFDAIENDQQPVQVDHNGHLAAPMVAPHIGGGNPPAGGSGGGMAGGPGGAPNGGGPLTPFQQGSIGYGKPADGSLFGSTFGGKDTKTQYDSATAHAIDGLIYAGRPYNEAEAFAQAQGGYHIDPAQYAASQAYVKQYPKYQGGFTEVTKDAPLPFGERFRNSPLAASAVGTSNAMTFGLNDEALAGAKSLVDGTDYTQNRDNFNANKALIGQNSPTADLLGNVAGGALMGRFAPGLMPTPAAAALSRLKAAAPIGYSSGMATAQGAAYGAGQSNDNRLGGAFIGGMAGLGGDAAIRLGAKGIGGMISPPSGAAAPLYEAGVRPTLGQRVSQVPFVGKAVNGLEQAMQSFPGLGSMVSMARQAPRDQWQLGGFNNAMKELEPFGNLPTSLPEGVKPGTEAQAFAGDAFDQAYPVARSGMQVDKAQLVPDHKSWLAQVDSGVLNKSQADQVKVLINKTVMSRLKNGPMTGQQYQAAGTELNKAISAWGKDPASSHMANVVRDYRGILDDAARRSSDPNSVALLDAADKGYAQLVRLQRAGELGGVKKDAGTFSPTSLAQADKSMSGGVRSNAWNKGLGLMQDYAESGKMLEDTLPNSGTADRLGARAALGGGEMLAAYSQPQLLAAFAPYIPGVDRAFKAAIAPRSATLSPLLAARMAAAAAKVNQLAPVASRLALPGVIDWSMR